MAALLLLAAPAAASGPVLRVRSLAPFEARGSGFRPVERIRLVLTVEGETHAKSVRAASTGRFVARFLAVRVDECTAWTLRATGSRGSGASTRARPIAPCAAP